MANALTDVLDWQKNRWFPFKDQLITSAHMSVVSDLVSQVTINESDHFYVPFVEGRWTLADFFLAEVYPEELTAIEGSTNILVRSPHSQILKFYPSITSRVQRERTILKDISLKNIGPKVLSYGDHYVLLKELEGPNLWEALVKSPRELFLKCCQVLETFHQSTSWNHGDFHLGQVIVSPGSLKIIDFEGEISQDEDDDKQTQLYDWVCLFRSLHYWCVLNKKQEFWSLVEEKIMDFCQHESVDLFRALMDKRLAHELKYEESFRPSWVHIPQAGMSWWNSFQKSL